MNLRQLLLQVPTDFVLSMVHKVTIYQIYMIHVSVKNKSSVVNNILNRKYLNKIISFDSVYFKHF